MICKDHQDRLAPAATHRYSNPVSAEIDCLLGPKSLKELEVLEKQISGKLQSNEPIDVEYWEQLLRNVAVYKSRAELNAVYRTIIANRLSDLRQEQRAEAFSVKRKLSVLLTGADESLHVLPRAVVYSRQLDPQSLLKLRLQDKPLNVIAERTFLDQNVSLDKSGFPQSLLICTSIGSGEAESHKHEVCALPANSVRQKSSSVCSYGGRGDCFRCLPLCTGLQ